MEFSEALLGSVPSFTGDKRQGKQKWRQSASVQWAEAGGKTPGPHTTAPPYSLGRPPV